MRQLSPWLIGAIVVAGIEAVIIGNAWLAPKPGGGSHEAERPFKAEPIEGTKLKRLTLTKKAVERLDLKTAALGEEEVVRLKLFNGEVQAVPAPAAPAQGVDTVSQNVPTSGSLRVRVDLGTDVGDVATAKMARVAKLDDDDDDDDDEHEVEADLLEGAADDEDDSADGSAVKPAMAVRYFLLKGDGHGFTPGQRVSVKLPEDGSGKLKMVVPYSAVIYDTKAQAWVYTNTAQLTFVRHPIEVDHIQGDKVVLASGPALGTPIVTVGVAELWGAESGMGH